MSASRLLIRDLVVRRRSDGHRVLHGIDLAVGQGVTALLGETGSGKSTLLNCVLGLLPDELEVESGEIALDLADDARAAVVKVREPRPVRLDRLSADRKRALCGSVLGYVPQDALSGLNPLMSIRDSIVEAVQCHRRVSRTDAVALAAAAMRKSGLSEDFIRDDAARRPKRVSGGQCQRALIAQALVNDPLFIFYDEPTTALDTDTKRQVLGHIRETAREGRAALIVTHDTSAALSVADRVAVLYLGRVVESGPTHRVLGEPRHPYTRGLLDCVPRMDIRHALRPIPGEIPSGTTTIPGCGFHPRCPYRREACARDVPATRPIADEWEVACHVF